MSGLIAKTIVIRGDEFGMGKRVIEREVKALYFKGEQFAYHAEPSPRISHIQSGLVLTSVPNKREGIKVLREIRRLKLPVVNLRLFKTPELIVTRNPIGKEHPFYKLAPIRNRYIQDCVWIDDLPQAKQRKSKAKDGA